MRFIPATLLCAATGCAQIFGLDVTTSGPDANLDRASLQVQRVSIGATVQKNPQDLSGQMATFYEDDGAGGFTSVPGELGPMDVFTAPINMGTPPVKFNLPNNQTYYWSLPARAYKANYIVYEHPNPQPADPASKIMLTSTLPSPYTGTDQFQLLAVGAWTQHTLTAAELPDPIANSSTISTTIDYSTFNALFGVMTRTRITAADHLLLLRYTSGKLTGVMQAPFFDQTAGTDPVSSPLTAVSPSATTVNVPIDPTGYATRYSAVRPAPGALSMSYSINAAPGWSVLNNTGILLASGGSAMTDSMLTTSFGNPFESLMWKSVVSFSSSTPRMTAYTYMGMPVSLGAGMYQIQLQEAVMAITLPAPLPITVRVNNTALLTDGMTVALDVTKPIEVKADLDKTTAPSAYSVQVDEILATGARSRVLNAVSAGTMSIMLPPGTFQVGKAYVLQYQTYAGGYPNAAQGDLQTLELPYSSAYLDSGAFTVVAP